MTEALSLRENVSPTISRRERGAWRQYTALLHNQMRFMWADKEGVVLMLVVPIISIAFSQKLFEPLVHLEGYPHATGSIQSVPGLGIFFLLYLPTMLSVSMFREHIWNTWSRLRVLSVSKGTLLAGQVSAWAFVGLVQQALIVGSGLLFFGLPGGTRLLLISVPGVLLIGCCSAIGVILYSLCRDIAQISGFASIMSLVMGGTAGALVPLSVLPRFVGWIGRLYPPYWALRAYHYSILGGNMNRNFVLPVVVLLCYFTALLIAAVTWFKRDMRKLV